MKHRHWNKGEGKAAYNFDPRTSFPPSSFRKNTLWISQNTVKCVRPISPNYKAQRKVIICAEVWKNYAYVMRKCRKSFGENETWKKRWKEKHFKLISTIIQLLPSSPFIPPAELFFVQEIAGNLYKIIGRQNSNNKKHQILIFLSAAFKKLLFGRGVAFWCSVFFFFLASRHKCPCMK